MHNRQMRSAIEQFDVEFQFVHKDGIVIAFATQLVQFEYPSASLESNCRSRRSSTRNLIRRSPTPRLMRSKLIVPSVVQIELVPKSVNPQRYQDTPSTLVLERKNESFDN